MQREKAQQIRQGEEGKEKQRYQRRGLQKAEHTDVETTIGIHVNTRRRNMQEESMDGLMRKTDKDITVGIKKERIVK